MIVRQDISWTTMPVCSVPQNCSVALIMQYIDAMYLRNFAYLEFEEDSLKSELPL